MLDRNTLVPPETILCTSVCKVQLSQKGSYAEKDLGWVLIREHTLENVSYFGNACYACSECGPSCRHKSHLPGHQRILS